MLWFRAPQKVYFKKGCMPVALDELGTVMGKKKCFSVPDAFLYKNGYVAPIEEKLDQLGIQHTCFYDVAPDPNLSSALKGAQAMRLFEPDCIIALGGGGSTKLISPAGGRNIRFFAPKYPAEYISGIQKTCSDKQGIIDFYSKESKK